VSERGSFVTSCACDDEIARILSDPELWGVVETRLFSGVLAGYLNYSWAGQAVYEFEQHVLPALEAVIRGPISVAVMEESGELSEIFYIEPAAKKDEAA
jgi:hypothetical protein